MNSLKEFYIKHRELCRYTFFGIGTTLINWLVYAYLVTVHNADITIANLAAWFFAILFAFLTNKLFVFESLSFKPAIFLREMLTFFGARSLSGIFEIIGPGILIGIGISGAFLGIDGFWAKAIVSIIVVVANYVLSKIFIFKKTQKEKPD